MRRRRKTPTNERTKGGERGGAANRSWTSTEDEDSSREPSERRAASRFVRRPGNPECGFVRRRTFLFLPPQFRPFARCFVRVFSSFLRQKPQRKRQMHAFRCCRRQEHELACLSLLFPTRIPSYQLASSNVHSGRKVFP